MRSSFSTQFARGHAARARVLIVEDDPDAALFVAHVLTKMSVFEVAHTPDPAVALALAAAEPWDLVLADLDLPVMSGLQLLAALRKLAPGLPVAILSARVLDDAHVALCSSRPDAVLIKPVSAEGLLAAVTALAAPACEQERSGPP